LSGEKSCKTHVLSASAVRIEEIRCVIEAVRKRRADCGSVEPAVCSARRQVREILPTWVSRKS